VFRGNESFSRLQEQNSSLSARNEHEAIQLFAISLSNAGIFYRSFQCLISICFQKTFDEDQYLECLKNLLLLDKAWIPSGRGYSLYIRPTAVSTQVITTDQPALLDTIFFLFRLIFCYFQSTLGVSVTGFVKNFVVCSPVGPYFPEGILMRLICLCCCLLLYLMWSFGVGFTAVKLLADPSYVRAWPGGTGYIKCGG
jgi:branched-chain amino acid aminotransferase